MTKIRSKALWCLAAILCGAVLGVGQNTTNEQVVPAPYPAKPQFFAGTVVEFDSRHIKVARTLVGRPTESRSFAINAQTKMNKASIRVKTRVTVRYGRQPEGDIALEIQLRPAVRSPKASP
jgi:hypothetical protein